MHSAITKQTDYNHVLNKLQDYMLTGKVLAKTFYQQGSNNERKSKSEEPKPAPQIIQKKEKELEKFFYPREKDQLFWCFFIIQNGFENMNIRERQLL